MMAAVTAAGAAASLLALLVLRAHPGHYPLLLIVAAGIVGTVRLEMYGDRVSLGSIPVIAAGMIGGPVAGTLAGLLTAAGSEFRTGRLTQRTIFNLGLLPLAGLASAWAAHPLGAQVQSPAPVLLLYGCVSSLALYAVNVAVICIAVSLQSGANPFDVWSERFRWVLPQTVLLGQVGVGLALADRLAGPYEVLVFALPVVVMQLAWRQYLEHTRKSVEDLRSKNSDLVQLSSALQTANETITATYQETLDALITALDARDNEVQGHSYRVSIFSQEIALSLGVERGSPEFDAISRGALLHDVGKIGVRDAVLLKPGKLDPAEWVEMKLHPDIGFGILRDVEFLQSAADMVRAHHEKFDGTGYPLGLAGDEIPLGARIFSVADTFDAITTDRPYRKAAPPQAAVAEIGAAPAHSLILPSSKSSSTSGPSCGNCGRTASSPRHEPPM